MTRRVRAANRLYSGSVQIGWRIARWPWERPEWRSRAARLGVQAAGVGALLAADAQPRVMEYLAGGWLLAAWRASDREEAEEHQAAAEAELQAEADELFLRLLVRLIGDEPGIHLETLLPALHEAEGFRGWTRADLRDLLADLRVPVRRSLRVGARTGVPGVHRDDARTALLAYLADHSPAE